MKKSKRRDKNKNEKESELRTTCKKVCAWMKKKD